MKFKCLKCSTINTGENSNISCRNCGHNFKFVGFTIVNDGEVVSEKVVEGKTNTKPTNFNDTKSKSGIYLQKRNIIIALSILILTITNPDYLDHKREITKVINRYSSSSNDTMELLGESLASTLADGLIGKIVDVNSYVLFSVGSITFKGNERNLTLGILGNVFSIESFTKPH
tara:strand:+ start:426 stop:944 length:519 start_codon:yes stop_codon:yes gene_type:complete